MELLLKPGDAATTASAWVRRWSQLVPPGATVLDVACGSGRHVRWFASRGCRVTAVDRDAAMLLPLRGQADGVVADLEAAPWPFGERRFDAVVVTNYLWRPLLPTLLSSVADGGVLIYETFADGQQTLGKPSNPDFLLQPGELLRAADGLRVVAFEDGFEGSAQEAPERFVQRLVAVREAARAAPPPRYTLGPPPVMSAQLKSADSGTSA